MLSHCLRDSFCTPNETPATATELSSSCTSWILYGSLLPQYLISCLIDEHCKILRGSQVSTFVIHKEATHYPQFKLHASVFIAVVFLSRVIVPSTVEDYDRCHAQHSLQSHEIRQPLLPTQQRNFSRHRELIISHWVVVERVVIGRVD